MKTLYCRLFFCFLTIIAQPSLAQTPNQLMGSLQDQKGAAIVFGTVAVLQADNAAYQGPSACGFYKIADNWGIDVGLKHSFMNDKMI